MPRIVSRTRFGMSTYVSVVISPATTTRPVVISVSHATRPSASSASTASSTESEIWSAILSGWPSVTDSEVKEKERLDIERQATEPRGLLLGWLAPHQAGGEFGQVLPGEDCAHAFGDRQLDSEPAREVAQDRRRRQALHGLADLGNGALRCQALRDQLAGVTVPRFRAAAADDKITDAREAGERLGPRARSLTEPRHLCEAARDERRLRVVAEPEPVHAAGGESDYVLRRGTELDPDEVWIEVGPEDARVDRVLELACEEPVLARDHRRCRQARRDLLCDVRAGKDGNGATGDAGREALPRLRVEPLGEAEHRRGSGKCLDDLREGTARHGGGHDVDVLGGIRERDCLRRAQVDALQVTGIPAGLRDRLRLFGSAAREDDVVAPVEQHACERRSPRARADDEEPHRQDRLTKSIETGTPSRPKRSRRRFSTQ